MKTSQEMTNPTFGKMPTPKLQFSNFKLDRNYTGTCQFDTLIPFFIEETNPNETFNIDTSLFARLSSNLVSPLMDNYFIDIFFFVDAKRNLWSNFTKMMGAVDVADGESYEDYSVPQIKASFSHGKLMDKFGVPVEVPLSVSQLPLRMYQRIWNYYFRNVILQQKQPDYTDVDDDLTIDPELLKVNKDHDYFTGAWPTPQLGNDIYLPIGDSAPVHGTGEGLRLRTVNNQDQVQPGYLYSTTQGVFAGMSSAYLDYHDTLGGTFEKANAVLGVSENPIGSGLIADLSRAVSATINEFRMSFALQHVIERDLAGTRWVDILKNHWNQSTPDYRLQQPEYIGGTRIMMQTNPVAQTMVDDNGSGLGNVAAFGTGAGQTNRIQYHTMEDCYIMGLLCIRGKVSYQQGLHPLWSRQERFDHYHPELANIGAQPIYNREIYAQGNDGDEEIFGYKEAWKEYKTSFDLKTGEMRSSHPTSLDSYHLSEQFGQRPNLNSGFLTSKTPIGRCITVDPSVSDPVLVDINIRCSAKRPMPFFAIPGLSYM